MANVPDDVWPGGMPAVGQMAERSSKVHRSDIEHFTDISGDRNPLHYDEAVARRTRFGEIVVQGGVTSAILHAVVAEELPGPGTVFLQVNWNFKAPVRPGDTITGRVEVLEVRSDKPITKLRTSVTRDDRTVVLEGDADCYTMPLAYLQVVGPRDPLRMRTYPARGQFFRRRRQTQHLLFGAPLAGHSDGMAQPRRPDVGSGKRYEFGTKTTGRTGTYGDEWNAMTGPFTGVPAGKGGRGERI